MIERAFVRAHLTRNPFGEPTPEERAALALMRVSVPATGLKLQLLGAQGAGKTSALRALERAMPGARYLWTDLDGALDGALPTDADAPLLLDEAQRLRDHKLLRRLLHGGRTVVLGSHEDLSRFAPAPSRSATLPLATIRLDRAPRTLLDDVVRSRLAWARRGAEEPVAPPRELLDALHDAHAGNLRAIEHALYAWYQQHWS